jgi:hypothetical protein
MILVFFRSPICLVHAGLDGRVNAALALLHTLDGLVQVLASLQCSKYSTAAEVSWSMFRPMPFHGARMEKGAMVLTGQLAQ